MTYTLSFVLNLKTEGTNIVYDPEAFEEKQIRISVPEVVEIFKSSILEAFEEVGIVEVKSRKSIQDEKEAKADNNLNSNQHLSLVVSNTMTSSLTGLSGKAYIRRSKEVDKDRLKQFCLKLTEYIQSGCSKLSSENFLTAESTTYFAGLSQVIELRNYLSMYTQSEKKILQDGYLYVMSL